MQPTDELLAQRGKQHGEFTEHATITQNTKDLWRNTPGWDRLTPIQREALEMHAHKVGRILAGNPDHHDHWDDIAGYARLVSQRIPAQVKLHMPTPRAFQDVATVPSKPPLSDALRAVDRELNGGDHK